MKKTLLALTVLILACSLPVTAARTLVAPITHPLIQLSQSYPGNSEGTNLQFRGYDGAGTDVISSVPGIFSITPGDRWANFVGAAREGIPYGIKNVVLTKDTPQIIQCSDLFPAERIHQQGTPNVRLWWPLMYEIPGTRWTLTILYGTYAPWDDDGPGPNPASYVHTEIWQWEVVASLEGMQRLLELFHELPFGTDEVPLISDEELYPALQAKISDVILAIENENLILAAEILADFEMEVADACIGTSPINPDPSGPGTGIAFTSENPTCCKLMADAEYVGAALQIWLPSR